MDPHTRTTQALWEDVDEARHLLENGAAGAHGGLSGQSHLSTSREPEPLRRHGTFNISYFLVAGFQTSPSVRVTVGRPPLLSHRDFDERGPARCPFSAAVNNSWSAQGCDIWPLVTLTFPGGYLQIHE